MLLSNTCIGLNIFVITELTITTLLCLSIKGVTSDVQTRTFQLLQQAEQFIKVLVKHGCLTLNTPVQSQSRSIITMIWSRQQSGIYGFLLGAQGTSCSRHQDHLDRVHSDQMVLEMIRQGRLPVEQKLSGGQESQN